MLKLFVYPNAREHVQDNMEDWYANTVPFSREGLRDHCILVSPQEAEYFYMGQVSCGLRMPEMHEFKHFVGNEDRHIIDFEGDWFSSSVPGWLRRSLISVTGVKKEYKGMNIFPRFPLSHLLLDIIRNNRSISTTFPKHKKFAFRGFPDPRGVRIKAAVAASMAGVEGDIVFNETWQAKAEINSDVVREYCNSILNSTFYLCPSGTGVDSIRFFEVCYFARVPVVISNAFTMGHEINKKTPFYFQVDPANSVETMASELKKISETPEEQVKEMSANAKEFFEGEVRNYFEDPTLKFIEWLKQEKRCFD
jgi:hypothetical protein